MSAGIAGRAEQNTEAPYWIKVDGDMGENRLLRMMALFKKMLSEDEPAKSEKMNRGP